jgi:TolB-like protein
MKHSTRLGKTWPKIFLTNWHVRECASRRRVRLRRWDLPQDAAKRLTVDAVFIGTIRLSGDQVKVRVELVDGRSGLLTWGDTLTSPRGEIATRGPAMVEEILNRLRIALAAKQ